MGRVNASAISLSIAFAMIGVVQIWTTPSFATQGAGDVRITPPPKPTAVDVRIAEERQVAEAILQHQVVTETPILDVKPGADISDVELARQSAAASLIREQAERAQFIPEGRIKHYQWINPETTPPITGWQGTIQKMVESPDGLLVRMRVAPKFPGNFLTTWHTVETYLIRDGVVHPAGIEFSDPELPRVITSP